MQMGLQRCRDRWVQMAEGRGRAGIQGKARVAIPAWVPAHAVGVDFCERLLYDRVWKGHRTPFLLDVSVAVGGNPGRNGCFKVGVSIGRVFLQVKWGQVWGIPHGSLWGMT